jgi:hypothetical protein
MKHKNFLGAGVCFTLGLLLASCGDLAMRDSYKLSPPALPAHWQELLGPALWRIEWFDGNGEARSVETASPVNTDIVQEWASAVIAWPFWPEKGIPCGVMKPAGAIFPLDASGGTLNLSWQGGVDAYFYLQLAAVAHEKRTPYYFNWQRFRELFSNEAIPEEIVRDPWLADWRTISVNTVSSGFDRRRIVSEKRDNLNVAIPADGPWCASSPFIESALWRKDETILFQVRNEPDSYFCPSGYLHCAKNAWAWKVY